MSLSTVSATIQDPSGQVFANGTWQLIFKSTYGTPGLFTDSGLPFNTLYGGLLDATGSFSQVVNRNDTISPANSHWTLIVAPNASGQSYSVDLVVNSAIFSASALINAVITNILVPATPIAHAYKDSEIILTPSSGSQYYDNVNKVLKIWDTSLGVWQTLTPTGGNPTFNNVLVNGTLGVTGVTSVGIINTTGQVTIGNNLVVKGPVPWADVTQYGLVGDNATDNTAAFNTMMATLCANNQAHTVYFPITAGGNYLFNSAPNAIGCEVVIKCGFNPVQWNPTGVDSAQLTANYTEAVPTNAFISFTGSTSPGNSGIEGCLLWKGLGKTGGTAIKYTGTSTTQRAGGGPIRDTRVSGDGTWNWSVRVDCTNITTAGSPGCRDIVMQNFDSFQTTTGCMSLNNAVHFYWSGGTCLPTGGNGHVDVTGLVTANAQSINVEFVGVEILDTLALDFVGVTGNPGFTCSGCTVNNLTASANVQNSIYTGISINAPVNSGQLSFLVNDPTESTTQGVSLVDSLRSLKFIGTGSMPSNVATGDLFFSNGATSGNLKPGSDGQCILRRNNGFAAGSNLAITGDAFGTTPYNFEMSSGTTIGFQTTKQISSSIATGTAPLVIASTTPVPNLTLTKHPTEINCGTTSACAGTADTSVKIVRGSAPLVSGTPSAVTITGISPAFASTTSYNCACTNATTQANPVKVANVSASSFTITGPATVSDVINYVCIGT